MKPFLLVIFVLLLTGCYNYNEIEKTAIIDAISIDYIDDQYYVTFEIIKNTESDNIKLSSSYVDGFSSNLLDAFYQAETKVNANPFFSHLGILIINDEIISNHFDDIKDFILRNPRINNNVKVLGTTTYGYTLLKNCDQSDITSIMIDNLIKNDYNNDYIKNIYFDDVLNTYLSYGIDSPISLIDVDDSNTYYFKGMQVINHSVIYDNDDVRLFNILNNNVKNIIFTNDYSTFRVNKVKTTINLNEKSILVNLEGELSSINQQLDLEKYHHDYQELIQKKLTRFYLKIKKEDLDLLGINQRYYQKHNKKNDYFKNDFKIVVNIKINKYGLIYEVNNEL